VTLWGVNVGNYGLNRGIPDVHPEISGECRDTAARAAASRRRPRISGSTSGAPRVSDGDPRSAHNVRRAAVLGRRSRRYGRPGALNVGSSPETALPPDVMGVRRSAGGPTTLTRPPFGLLHALLKPALGRGVGEAVAPAPRRPRAGVDDDPVLRVVRHVVRGRSASRQARAAPRTGRRCRGASRSRRPAHRSGLRAGPCARAGHRGPRGSFRRPPGWVRSSCRLA
jgi:hypothetical protein